MRKVFIVATASVMALAATACNTVQGAGEDVESVAEEVDEEI